MGRVEQHAAPGGEYDPLLSSPATFSSFEYANRPRRDVGWLIAYVLVMLLACGGGIFSFVNRNQAYNQILSPDSLNDPKACPLPRGDLHDPRRRLHVRDPGQDAAWQADKLLANSAWLLAVSTGGALLLGAALLLAARHHPRVVVWGALIVQVCLPLGGGMAGLMAGAPGLGAFLLALGGLLALAFVLWRQQIDLVVSLLGVSGSALSANMGLVPLTLGLQLVLCVVEVPLVLSGLAALMNGRLVYNDARADHGAARFPGECVDDEKNVVPCCAWDLEDWVPAQLALVGLAATWTVFLISEVKIYVTAGSVGQWYFAPAEDAAATAASGAKRGRRPSRVLTSLGHAAGPSLGSLCAGSAVLTLVSMLRSAMEKAKRESANGNLVAACAMACASCLLSLVEALTRFATVQCALTGQSFFAAGEAVTSMLSRNFLDSYGVWWLPPLVLQSCCAVLGGAWALGVYWVGRAVWSGMPEGAAAAMVVAGIAFLAAWVVLSFCAGLLLDIISAVYVCFGMERDARTCARPEVYVVYCSLPSVGPLVEQPDGGVAYGQPQHPGGAPVPPPQQYPPPQYYIPLPPAQSPAGHMGHA